MTSNFHSLEDAISAGIQQVTSAHSDAQFVQYRGMTTHVNEDGSSDAAKNASEIKSLSAKFNIINSAGENLTAKSENFGPWELGTPAQGMINSEKVAWPPKLSLEEAWALKDKDGFTDPVLFVAYMPSEDVGLDEPAYWFSTEKLSVYVGATTGKVVQEKK